MTHRRTDATRGFTLLEVLLSLAISTIVIGALFMTINLQLKIADESRIDVEQAQLAHAILGRIADDLRNAVNYKPQDMSTAMAGGSSSAALASAAGASSALGGSSSALDVTQDYGTGGTASASTGGDTSSSTTNSSTTDSSSSSSGGTTDSGEPLPIPGVYGTNVQLQVDISRIPRMDEYVALMENGATGTASDLLSDIKTVTYYILGQDNNSVITPTNDPINNGQMGLYYRSVNRAATEFAANRGSLASIEDQGVVVSERVRSVQFEYFDGTEWVIDWDSNDRQGIPVAVKIYLEMYPQDWEKLTDDEKTAVTFPIYQTVVWLPAGEPTEAGAGSAMSSTDSSSTDSSSGNSSNGASANNSSSGGSGSSGSGGSGSSGSGGSGSSGGGSSGGGGTGGGGTGGGGTGGGGTGGGGTGGGGSGQNNQGGGSRGGGS